MSLPIHYSLSTIHCPAARHYHPALSIWLSVDPMSDKYPGVSPYVYCANYPVRLIDPDGREIGNYYNWYGKYLGTDGNDDGMVYLISDKKSQRIIKSNNRKNCTTTISDVKADVSTSINVLIEAVNVYNRTVMNGGEDEECSAFDCDGNLIRGARGHGGEAKLPISEGSVSIHSHRLTTEKQGKSTIYRTPELPSTIKNSGRKECDETSFVGFDLNIIVGDLSFDDFDGTRKSAMSFYGPIITNEKKDLTGAIGTIYISNVKKIIQHQDRCKK